MGVEEFNELMSEVNKRILEKIEQKKDMSKIRVAREYFCDAVILAMEKRLDDARYKLKQALVILGEVE